MTISIPRGNEVTFGRLAPPLYWWPLWTARQAATREQCQSATMSCSNGHDGGLMGHDIAPDGTVNPSVVCPAEGCGFHEFVRLEGWAER